MEDLLVSNVFGSIKYLSPKEGLLPILHAAEDIEGRLPLSGLTEISDVHYEFWPRLHERLCHECEPDVLITFNYPDGKKGIILIEAKYRSGKSSQADEGQASMDQLAKEFENLTERAKLENAIPILLYVTAHFGFPRKDIAESEKEFSEKNKASLNALWLSWRKMPHLFKSAKNDTILYDLSEVLKGQGLLPFEGITKPKFYALKWRFNAGKDYYYHWSIKFQLILWRYGQT